MNSQPMDNSSSPENDLFSPRMKPNTPGKVNYKRTFLIGLAFLSSQTAWAYYNFMMPIVLREFLQEAQFYWLGTDTFVGLIMILDNVVAILMLPYFGVLSDHTKSKHGRRMPYIMIGCTFGAIVFSIIPQVKVLGWLFAVITFFNLSMAFYRSCSISLMPDLTDPKVRSTGNAIIQIMGGLSFILGMLGPIIMEAIYDTSTLEGRSAARAGGFYFVSIIMLIALTILFTTIKETPTGTKFLQVSSNNMSVDPTTLEFLGEIEDKKVIQHKKMDFLKLIFKSKDKSIIFLLLAIFASSFGFNAIETYYSSYATVFLGWSDAMASTALMMAPISLFVFAVPAGKISDKLGRKRSFMIGLIGLSVCVEILHNTQNFAGDGFIVSMIVIFCVGLFYALISVNAIVMVWQMAPKGQIGTYSGAYYLFTQTAAILSPVVMGLEFDLYIALYPQNIARYGVGYQYRMLFFFVLIWQIFAIILMFGVKGSKNEELNKTAIKDLQEKYADS